MDERQQYDILFGSRLDDLRKERGMTKKDLWKAIGISDNTGRGYLQGKVEPTLYIIYKLCQALGCSADDLVDPEIDLLDISDNKHAAYSSPEFEVRVMSRTGKLPTMLVLSEDRALAVDEIPHILSKTVV